MKLLSIKIHNFRAILDGEFQLNDFSLLIGENNSGKTAVLDALRIFYEDDIKYVSTTDFPKIDTDDKESWIELQFQLTNEEIAEIKDQYKSNDGLLKVRRLFQSETHKDKVKSGQSNIYYVSDADILSEELFYGAKNVSQAKLGEVVYIPEISNTKDSLKTSGPSPFRDTLNIIFERVIKSSKRFEGLEQAFEEFNKEFPSETSKDGHSIEEFKKEINEEVKRWGVSFDVDINPIQPKQIVKELLSHNFSDNKLKDGNQKVDASGSSNKINVKSGENIFLAL
jgi:predicted ATP-dependent endonuclease of OLD family